MNYKSYATAATTPNRKVRKSMRYTVFTFNKRAKHVQRKAERASRKEQND